MTERIPKISKRQMVGGLGLFILVGLIVLQEDADEANEEGVGSISSGATSETSDTDPREVDRRNPAAREQESGKKQVVAGRREGLGGHSKPASKHLSVENVFAGFSNYEPPTGHFEVIQREPVLHIRVGAVTVGGEPVDIVRENLEREAVTAVFLAFTFSDAQAIRVTAQPLRVGIGSPKSTLAKKPSVTVEVSRRAAKRFLASSSKLKSFEDLVVTANDLSKDFGESFDDRAYKNLPLAMKFNEVATRPFLFNDQGAPGLKRTLAALQTRR
jgi:hypothetical protein